MSVVYPEYIIVENEFFRLWSIDDGSWGFNGYSCELTKMYFHKNSNIKNIFYYWSHNHEYFKLIIDNYEGVFSKKDHINNPHSPHTHYNDIKEVFELILKDLTVKEKNDENIILTYNDKINFILYKVNMNYITKISENTKNMNELIKKNYEEGIESRLEILNDCKHDY